MRKIASLVFALTFLIISCEGEQGPPGFDGQDGVNFVGQSFETLPLDFTANNSFEQSVLFPENIEIDDDDMVLVYLLWDENPDTWRLLPQTIYTDSGEFQYNFQDNFTDVTIFLDAPSDFDFNTLLSGDTLNQVFRVVVLPIEYISSNNLDITNYDDVMEYVQ
ncbi:dihydrolipoamide dehydrogenase [Winogradskyella sp. F6397]|uniref:Dihydrolipoamide dehydrogenase n=1 Tax=Winogradskyella marina TaxID=2785530 RepID=A0ABS0EHN0_9FLAO|nr:dihydrolipoamide dehydrogenase [Winogradskyella marina]MBF8149944.1 dihydrolipoamide dehydrogenase [Winogradskyella marina]